MSRQLRILHSEAVYHVTSRGNGGETIFLDAEDRKSFLGLLSVITARHGFVIYAFCLMDNHYHLLLRTPRANLPDGMRQLNGVYSQGFNRRHQRRGHVFQGRYDARLVEVEGYLAEVARYIMLNPLRAGMVKRVEEWEWSSYRATVGLGPVPPFLRDEAILSLFGDNRADAGRSFAGFVGEGVGMRSPFDEIKKELFIGSSAGSRILEAVPADPGEEIPIRERNVGRPPLEDIFSGVDRREGSRIAVVRHGYRLREVGEFLGIHYSVVSRMLKAFERGE